MLIAITAMLDEHRQLVEVMLCHSQANGYDICSVQTLMRWAWKMLS